MLEARLYPRLNGASLHRALSYSPFYCPDVIEILLKRT